MFDEIYFNLLDFFQIISKLLKKTILCKNTKWFLFIYIIQIILIHLEQPYLK